MLRFHDVAFTYDGSTAPIFDGLRVDFPPGWTGVIGANGAGKTTLLRLACGELAPERGSVQRFGLAVYCPQRTDDPPAELAELITSTEAIACRWRGRLQVGEDWLARWDSLSHGERKRAQIAAACLREPDVLLVDEPTNHIDREARRLLLEALASFRGIGLIVSHDRDLLDTLCRQCLVIDPPRVTLRPGGYMQVVEQARQEEESTRARYNEAKENWQRLRREEIRRLGEAGRADRKRSKRGLARGDSDGRGKIDAARVSGKDGKAGRLADQLRGRVRQAEEALAEIRVIKRYDIGFWLPDSRSPRRLLFTLPPQEISFGDGRRLCVPELTMAADDRVAVTGVNGSGKSTLIRHLLAQVTLPPERIIYLPQEIDRAEAAGIMAQVRALPSDQLGHLMTVVSGLGSRPARLLETLEASPGEVRKVLLGLGILRSPYLIVMDEPTNHLDLPAIECLESALQECPCGLLLVSHDERFLGNLARIRWYLAPAEHGVVRLTVG